MEFAIAFILGCVVGGVIGEIICLIEKRRHKLIEDIMTHNVERLREEMRRLGEIISEYQDIDDCK